MDEKVLTAIIKANSFGDASLIARAIIASYDQINEIKAGRRRLEDEIQKSEDKHKQEIKEIKEKLSELRKKCKHESTNYYPDASGNNDCYTECNFCGAEV